MRLPAAMAPSTTPPTNATSRTRASHARQRRRDSARITRTRAPKLTSCLAVWPIVSRRQRMSAGVSWSCWHPGLRCSREVGRYVVRLGLNSPRLRCERTLTGPSRSRWLPAWHQGPRSARRSSTRTQLPGFKTMNTRQVFLLPRTWSLDREPKSRQANTADTTCASTSPPSNSFFGFPFMAQVYRVPDGPAAAAPH